MESLKNNYSDSSSEEMESSNNETTSTLSKTKEGSNMELEDLVTDESKTKGNEKKPRENSPKKYDKDKRYRDNHDDKHKYDKDKYRGRHDIDKYRSKDRDDKERVRDRSDYDRDRRTGHYSRDTKHRGDDSRNSDRSHYKDKDYRRSSDDKYRKYSYDEKRDRRRRSSSKERNRDRRHKSKSKSVEKINSRGDSGKVKKRSHSKSPPPSQKKVNLERTEIKIESPIKTSSASASSDEAVVPSQPTLLPLAPPVQLPRNNLIAGIPPPAELPSYYNPNVINVNKYVEQQKKRKLLWSSKKDETAKATVANKWENAKFSQDSDGKVASKFMRLMGIKDAPKEAATTTTNVKEPAATGVTRSSEDMFQTMEQQYEVARAVTHMNRGVGLGFASKQY